MALVTVQRSPSDGSSPPSSEYGSSCHSQGENSGINTSLSEYYLAVKGFAVLLPKNECQQGKHKKSTHPPTDIEDHLQAMLHVVRPGDTLQMVVRLESLHPGRVRFLAVAASQGRQDTDESCLIGIDFMNHVPTIGLVLRVLADMRIHLDGDGGFSVNTSGKNHIFKPVTVQAMWSALQTLHKESGRARRHCFFQGGFNHDWVDYYDQTVTSDQSCVNEWNTMDHIESKRPPSPTSLTNKEETEVLIRMKLKEIMMSVDIDEVTSKFIRQRLEQDLDTTLYQYKSFIDQEMLKILGQMDVATEVFPHIYLGSEWNASNLEELKRNGVGYILNVTKEIDNFFPGMFDYLNIRVYDDEKTELLKHWDDTFKYIAQAKLKNSKVLVHCKMGISRSASVVIAYAMKDMNLTLEAATDIVQSKRTCIKPNKAFKTQLKIYQGILDASRQRHNVLWRSKSETNLKSPVPTPSKLRGFYQRSLKTTAHGMSQQGRFPGDIPPFRAKPCAVMEPSSQPGEEERSASANRRPKSWSPDDDTAKMLFSHPDSDVNFGESLPKSYSLNDQTWQAEVTVEQWDPRDPQATSELHYIASAVEAINPVLMDQAIPQSPSQEEPHLSTSVKDRINEFESVKMKSPTGDGSAKSPVQSVIETDTMYVSVAPVTQRPVTTPDTVSHAFQYPSPIRDPSPGTPSPTASENRTPGSVKQQTFDFEEMVKQKEFPEPDSNSPKDTKKDSKKDPFSASLDKTFDREEKLSTKTQLTDTPSRNNSWGSFDSAVVLGDRDVPSRQSSWGSADTRFSNGSLISRNSSFSTHDKHSPSGDKTAFSPATLRCDSKILPVTIEYMTDMPPLKTSVSADAMPIIINVKQQTYILETQSKSGCAFTRSLSSGCVVPTADPEPEGKCGITRSMSEKRGRYSDETPPGKVKKLTRALESRNKSESAGKNKKLKALRQRSLSLDRLSQSDIRETPSDLRSSQTILSQLVDETTAQAQRIAKEHEEMGVKLLVTHFESVNPVLSERVPLQDSQNIMPECVQLRAQRRRVRPRSESVGGTVPPVPQRKSSLDIQLRGKTHSPEASSGSQSSLTRPPTTAQPRPKKQHGKTHPLSKLPPRDQ